MCGKNYDFSIRYYSVVNSVGRRFAFDEKHGQGTGEKTNYREGIEEVTSLRVPPLRGETLPALLI